jgi:hypothetical protein
MVIAEVEDRCVAGTVCRCAKRKSDNHTKHNIKDMVLLHGAVMSA